MGEPPPGPGRHASRVVGVTENERKQSRNDAYAALLQSAIAGSAPPANIFREVFTEDTELDKGQEMEFQHSARRRHQAGRSSGEPLRLPGSNSDSEKRGKEASEPPTSKAMQFIHKVKERFPSARPGLPSPEYTKMMTHMDLYLADPTSASRVYRRISRLFAAHDDLIADFHAFINPGNFLDFKSDGGAGSGGLKRDNDTLRRLHLRLNADEGFVLQEATSADPASPQQATTRPRLAPSSSPNRLRGRSGSGGTNLRKAIAASPETALLASNARVSARLRGLTTTTTTTRVQQIWDQEVKGIMDYSMGPPPAGTRRTRNSMWTAAGGFGDLSDFDGGRVVASRGKGGGERGGGGGEEEGDKDGEGEGSSVGGEDDTAYVDKGEEGKASKKRAADDDDVFGDVDVESEDEDPGDRDFRDVKRRKVETVSKYTELSAGEVEEDEGVTVGVVDDDLDDDDEDDGE